MTDPLFSLQDARVRLTSDPDACAVDGLDLTIRPGEVVGLVGESGCGKSVTALATMGLLPPSLTGSGRLVLDGRPFELAAPDSLAAIRGREVAMVFQDPGTALNPVMPVGRQIGDVLRATAARQSRRSRDRAVIELLTRVGVPAPERMRKAYPFELSGGMRQRVLIAMALACRPQLLIADEPTTALDATVQAQIIDLLRELAAAEDMAVLFISHDLALVAEFCQRVHVMYAGRVVEQGPVDDVLRRPTHPYTMALVDCLSTMGNGAPRLQTVPGSVPAVGEHPPGCSFAPRCPYAVAACAADVPALRATGPAESACIRADDIHRTVGSSHDPATA